jgi:hypothetical protein
MRSAGNFHPEWGYLAPAPSFMRTLRIVLVATAIGATAGAVVVVSLVERPGADDDNTSIAAHALVTSAPIVTAPVAAGSVGKAAALAQSPMPTNAQPDHSSAAPTLQASAPKTLPSISHQAAIAASTNEPDAASPPPPASMAVSAAAPPAADDAPAPVHPDVVVPDAAPARTAIIKKRRVEGYQARRHWQAANAKKRWRNNSGFGPLLRLFSFRIGSSRSTN